MDQLRIFLAFGIPGLLFSGVFLHSLLTGTTWVKKSAYGVGIGYTRIHRDERPLAYWITTLVAGTVGPLLLLLLFRNVN